MILRWNVLLVASIMGTPSAMAQVLPSERYTLENGLEVILHEDHTLPLVAVNIWYRVGSKDEPKGRTGFAHLFEHLMFMGTHRVPDSQFDELMEAGGGSNNATTSEDRTNYYSSGPSSLLPTLLWLEADRMEALGAAMTQEKLDLQREVVRNERRQSYENRPYGQSWLVLPEMLYPTGHPYRVPTIGTHEDLEAATLKDVQDFFAAWYVPNNASLVVAGDFDSKSAKDLIQSLFSSIPKGAAPAHRSADVVALRTTVKRTLTDAVSAPRTIMAWLSPKRFAPGDAEMDVVGDILTSGAASRLERVLVHEKRIAQDVSASQSSGTLSSEFMIQATALPGVNLDTLEEAIDLELQTLLKDGITADELRRVVNAMQAETLRELQELNERADRLNEYFTFLDRPDGLAFDLARYSTATPEQVSKVAREVLALERRAILRVIPSNGEVASETATKTLTRDDRPKSPEPVTWIPPLPETFRLGGGKGLEVWLLPRHQVPLVAMELVLSTGTLADPAGQAGLASLMGEFLQEGAGDRNAQELDAALDLLGSRLSIGIDRFSSSVSASGLSANLAATLDLMSDLLLRPRLDAQDFARVKKVRLAELEQRAANPSQVAAVVSNRRLRTLQGLPSHPNQGYVSTVSAVSEDAVRTAAKRWASHIPWGTLIVVGDVTRETLEDLLQSRFGHLEREPLDTPYFAPKELTGELEFYLMDRPDAPQTVVRFHRPGPPLSSPLTPALTIADVVLGGSFTSRLNQNLREKHGFTYGAGTSLDQGETTGTFVASSNVRTDVTGRALKEFLHEFDRVKKQDFTQAELEKALATERTERIKSFEDISDVVAQLASMAEARQGPEAYRAHYEALGQVHLDGLRKAAADHLVPSPGVLVLVGDAKRILPQLKGLPLPKPVRVDTDGRPLEGR